MGVASPANPAGAKFGDNTYTPQEEGDFISTPTISSRAVRGGFSAARRAEAHLASLLMRAGDIESNPGPGPRYPCGTCGRGVGGASVRCLECGLWHHRRCAGLSATDINRNARDRLAWRCAGCTPAAPLPSLPPPPPPPLRPPPPPEPPPTLTTPPEPPRPTPDTRRQERQEQERQAHQNQTPRYPCGACGRGVGGASVRCRACARWHHGQCAGSGRADINRLGGERCA